ncbi:hypothetical protein TNCV_3187561 [Trichonephila clavipes]|nr:hypothetical protein TNCV_3187561 [Trichonephila clavipes]
MKLIERLIEEGGSDSGSRNFVGRKISENVIRLIGRHFPSYVESDTSKKKKNIAKMWVCLPSASRHALLAKDLVTWQAMVGRHILEDIVGRVAQYVDEHYPVDKWHLGDLIAWVAQSALKYRPRICELSKCLEGPLKMIVCPKKLLPTLSHLVKLLYAARQ